MENICGNPGTVRVKQMKQEAFFIRFGKNKKTVVGDMYGTNRTL